MRNLTPFVFITANFLIMASCGSPLSEGDKTIPPPRAEGERSLTTDDNQVQDSKKDQDSQKIEDSKSKKVDRQDPKKDDSTSENIAQVGIAFDKLRNLTGNVCISLFQGSKGFPGDVDAAIDVICNPASSKEGPLLKLEAGKSYGIAAFHDENKNRKFDKRKLGPVEAPAEGYGFSTNPSFKPREPKYSEIDFIPKKGYQTMRIKFTYLF